MNKAICFYCELPIEVCDCQTLAEFAREKNRRSERKFPVVQVDPLIPEIGGCFVTVIDTTSSGILGYIKIPGTSLLKYVSLKNNEIIDTGGEAAYYVLFDDDPEAA